MPSPPHHAIQTVHERGSAVLAHAGRPHPGGGFWRRWFEQPAERQMIDDVRAFVSALNHLLDVPPTMITRDELTGVGRVVDQVVRCVEDVMAASSEAAGAAAAVLTPAIYVIRARYEELYKRGATKADGS